jgi:hypothetical protein
MVKAIVIRIIVASIITLAGYKLAQPKPVYVPATDTWSCPAGSTVTAGESDLVAGKPFVECSR